MLSGWRALSDPPPTFEKADFTLIVPFRNERENLHSLLSFFRLHTFNTSVIWVNDHSNDGGDAWLATQLSSLPHHTLLHCQAHEQGKKAALKKGISASQTAWVVSLDADVQLSPDWEPQMQRALAASKADLMILPLAINGNSLLAQWQQCEMLALTGLAGATAQRHEAMLANGAHLAFRKALYNDFVNARLGSQYSGGDDMFLLHFARSSDAHIQYAALPALVATVNAETGKALWNQRLRWAGKIAGHSNASQTTAAVALALGNVAAWCALLSDSPSNWLTFSAVLAGKFSLDCLFCAVVANKLNIRWNANALLTLQFIYPFYLIAVFISSRISTPMWKGRVVSLPAR